MVSSRFRALQWLVFGTLVIVVAVIHFSRLLDYQAKTKLSDRNATKIIFSPLKNESAPISSLSSEKKEYRPPTICGEEWQSKYQELHTDIVSGRRKPKFLAYSCPWRNSGCCGYGNRINALVSLFYLAILTDRAFLIDWREPKPLERYLIPKSIDWNFPFPNLATRKHYWRTGGEKSELRRGWLAKNTSTFITWLQREDMARYFDHPVEIATSYLYFARNGILRNKYLMGRARELKIRPLLPGAPPYSMIGCAYDYLFRPTKSLQNTLENTRKALRENAGNFVIGIHIRMGDNEFGRNETRVSNFKKFFSCAAKVEREIFHLRDEAIKRQCRWFLATDSLLVKKYAMKYFADKVITDENKPKHLDIYKEAEKSSEDGMMGVLHDHYLLAESDFLVLSKSSFGWTAVGLGMHRRDSYTLADECDLRFEKSL